MNKYETVFIISPNADSETIDKTIGNVENLIISNGGQVIKVDRWGKRRLAYEVKGNRDGFYVLINFDGDPEFIGRLSRYYGLEDEIIKNMTLRAEKLSEKSLSSEETEGGRAGSYDDEDEDDNRSRRRARRSNEDDDDYDDEDDFNDMDDDE